MRKGELRRAPFQTRTRERRDGWRRKIRHANRGCGSFKERRGGAQKTPRPLKPATVFGANSGEIVVFPANRASSAFSFFRTFQSVSVRFFMEKVLKESKILFSRRRAQRERVIRAVLRRDAQSMATRKKSRGLEREYFSSVEIAEHFGVSASTVLSWRDSGCPAIVLSPRIGENGKMRCRFRLEDVKAWLASFSQKGASGASQEGGAR